MAGVRVQKLEPQCTKDLLWKYFGDPKYGGGDISNVYYPLLNNDAVILFKDPSVTTAVLACKHERFKVVPLPHKVFSKMQVWVDPEMSVLIQVTERSCQTLKDQGGVEIGTDPKTQDVILTGEEYQIEWARVYLSQLKDNQINIANTLQRERETAAAYEYEKQRDTKSANMVNGNGADRSRPDPMVTPRRHLSHASAEVRDCSSPAPDQDRLDDKRQRGSPVTSETLVKSADMPVPKPRERVGTQHNDNAHSVGSSPHTNSLMGEGGKFDVGEFTSSMQMMTNMITGQNYSEKGKRQADANNTFSKFASLPTDTLHQLDRESDLTGFSNHPDQRPSPRPWKTSPSVAEIEQAERAHLDEYHHNSLDVYGASTDYRQLPHFSSLQPCMDREGTDINDEAAGAYGGARSLAPAILHRSLSHGASPRSFGISSYALMSNASIELSRKSFRIGKNLLLKIYVDDITKAHTEAVVNAANWELKNIGGVAGALAKAAGPEMADECDRLHRKHGHLKTAQVVKTKAYGRLRHMKCILHTVGPIYISAKQTEEESSVYELTQTFFNCLEFADKLELKSLTFPFISTGIFGMPMEQCVLAMVTALLVYSEQKTCSLEEVHFINNDIDVVCEAIIMAEQRLKIETPMSAIQRLDEGVQHYGKYVYPYCEKASPSSSKYKDEGKYSSFSSSGVGASASRSTGSRRLPDPRLDNQEPQSMPFLPSQTARPRSGSLDRGRNKAQDDGTLSSQRRGREPSPRPSSAGSRPRSSSADTRDKLKDVSSKKSETVHTESPKGKSTPAFKPALISTTGKKSNMAARLTRGGHPLKAVGGKSSDHSGVSDTDSASVAGSEDDDGTCPICLEPCRLPKKLPCGHTFCTQCLDRALAAKPKCPKCQRNFGIQTGTQPKNGRMTYRVDHSAQLPGYGHGVIVIEYFIPSGIQEACHPNPGQYYGTCQRTAYLPYNTEGKEVLKMLEKAFEQRLIFTVGDSHTTGATGVITWNDIHHKTSMTGGSINFGYPDQDYLRRVKEELADKGITSP